MTQQNGTDIAAAVLQIPRGLFILTSACEGHRSGVLTKWVQPCSTIPPLVMVAIAKGSPVEPLIRDSRAFALCQIGANDRLLMRRFASPPERFEDPFVTLPAHPGENGSPIIDRALSYLDCQVVRHIDLDADHRLYVGQIVAGAIMDPAGQPAVEVGQPSVNPCTNGTSPRQSDD